MLILGWTEPPRDHRPRTSRSPSSPPTRPPPASPASRPTSAAPRARSRTARSSAPPARSNASPGPAGDPAHARPRGRARARRRDVRRLPRQRRARRAVATAGYSVPESWHGLRIDPGEGAAGPRARDRPGRSSATTTSATSRKPEHPGGERAAEPRSRSRWRGTTSCAARSRSAGRTRRRVHDEDLRTLEAIAGLATVACRNAEAYEHVQHVARTDALTGVLNHGAMQLRIREEIARARRDGQPLGAVILDLDDFKRVNDTRGHAAGDELLRRVAQRAAGRAAPVRPGRPLRRRRVRAAAPRLRRGDHRRRRRALPRRDRRQVLDRRRRLARRPRRRRRCSSRPTAR